MSRFSSTVAITGDLVLVSFTGILDETCSFSDAALNSHKKIAIDLEGIERVTSKGIRAWMHWIATLDQSKKYTLQKCARVFVNQANLIAGLIPHWMSVASIELPYFCEACEHSFGEYIEIVSDSAPKSTKLTTPCPNCGKAAIFDAVPEKYFQFLNRRNSNAKP